MKNTLKIFSNYATALKFELDVQIWKNREFSMNRNMEGNIFFARISSPEFTIFKSRVV